MKCDIYALPNPIQGFFYTITITVKEGILESAPTVMVNEQSQIINTIESEANQIWSLAYPINQNREDGAVNRLQIDVFQGNNESGEKIGSRSVNVVLPMAPNSSYQPSAGKISAYPNPAQQSTLHLVCPTVNPPQVQIYTSDGRLVAILNDFQLRQNGWQQDWNLCTHFGERVSSGIYFAHFMVQEQFLTHSETIKLWIQQ